MDWSPLTWPTFNLDCLLRVFSIILIDVVLAGDNAVVIALAVKRLSSRRRLQGIVFGAGFAVVLRIVLTIFVAQLLQVDYVGVIGGLLIFWIGVKLLIQNVEAEESGREATTLLGAIWIIVVADVTMSTDNILALAGASGGHVFLLLFGLILSIPLVVFTSNLASRLMDRYPILVYLGAAVLGKVAAALAFTDPAVTRITGEFSRTALYVLFAVGAALVILVAKLYVRFFGSQRADGETATGMPD